MSISSDKLPSMIALAISGNKNSRWGTALRPSTRLGNRLSAAIIVSVTSMSSLAAKKTPKALPLAIAVRRARVTDSHSLRWLSLSKPTREQSAFGKLNSGGSMQPLLALAELVEANTRAIRLRQAAFGKLRHRQQFVEATRRVAPTLFQEYSTTTGETTPLIKHLCI
jgi:hypothetical protein